MDYKTGNIVFYQGEERTVDAYAASSNPNDLLIITSAEWTLTNSATGEVVDSGDCEIDGNQMTVFFGSDVAGYYALEITARIGRETLKQRCGVTFMA